MAMESLRNIYLVTDIDAYRGYFSDDWARRVSEITFQRPLLDKLFLGLAMSWRAAAYTVSLPVQLLDHTKQYHDGFVNSGDVNSHILRLASVIPAKLVQKLPELVNDPLLLNRLSRAIISVGVEVDDAIAQSRLPFPMQASWEEHLANHVFQLMLWNSQRICFTSVYNSYESFIVQCLKSAIGVEKCRTSDKRTFRDQMEKAFGAAVFEACWAQDSVNIARVARHSLAHADGAVTNDLGRLNHGFVVTDGCIQITPDDVKKLFSVLKNAAEVLIQNAVALDAFGQLTEHPRPTARSKRAADPLQ